MKSSTSSGRVFVWKKTSQNSTATSTTSSSDAQQGINQVCVYFVSWRLDVNHHYGVTHGTESIVSQILILLVSNGEYLTM